MNAWSYDRIFRQKNKENKVSLTKNVNFFVAKKTNEKWSTWGDVNVLNIQTERVPIIVHYYSFICQMMEPKSSLFEDQIKILDKKASF